MWLGRGTKNYPSSIHCSGVSRQGWRCFPKILGSFLMKHDYSIWYRKHLQTSLQPPSESLRASYAEKMMLNGSSVQELVKHSTSSFVLTLVIQSTTQHWVIKNPKVLKEDFDNIWIISRLFAFDDWKKIRKTLEDLLQ
uniref:Uncharacterized protein n=1 Tax=Cucumis melo TaxID=3656 RepID=A0A9I9EG90_CUCME